MHASTSANCFLYLQTLMLSSAYLYHGEGVDVHQIVEKNKNWTLSGDGKAKGALDKAIDSSDDEPEAKKIKLEAPCEAMQTLSTRVRFLKSPHLISVPSTTSDLVHTYFLNLGISCDT